METYDPKIKCLKCDHDVVRTEYHLRSYEDDCSVLLCDYEGQDEHIVRTCNRCGFEFFQKPIEMDAVVRKTITPDTETETFEETFPMMQLTREITTHHDGHSLNDSLRIKADEVGAGNASHHYQVDQEAEVGRRILADIQFQHGPLKEPGSTPGITTYALLAILHDHLSGFQSGEFACDETGEALRAIEEAMGAQKRRADERAERGVLGTYAK